MSSVSGPRSSSTRKDDARKDDARKDDAPAGARQQGRRSSGTARRPLLFEVPYAAAAPRLINPGLGLASLVPGEPPGPDSVDVTLLDAPDLRLIRAGVMLAHRVRDGIGEWHLRAEGWEPFLTEIVQPVGHGDLPDELADAIRPFRRTAPIGPVAALTSEHRTHRFTDVTGGEVATLVDHLVTIRRGGLTTARFREVTITPAADGPGLDEAQRAWVTTTLSSVGASTVDAFPRLPTRLGPPATGPSDYPTHRPVDRDDRLARWLGGMVSARLRALVAADLTVRTHDHLDGAGLTRTAAQLRRELLGLGGVLDEDALSDLTDDLGWLATSPEPELVARLSTERYLHLLEQLVGIARGTGLGEVGEQPARAVLKELLGKVVERFAGLADALEVDGSDETWRAAGEAARRVVHTCQVAGHAVHKRAHRVRTRINPLVDALPSCLGTDPASARAAAAELAAEAAFDQGRRFEADLATVRAARRAWLRDWAKASAKIRS